jgi:hypothetical protein
MVEWQEPGYIYVTSPTVFEHAVEYPECGLDKRVIAVQARFLVNETDLYQGFESEHMNQERDWVDLMEALAPALAALSSELPSLPQVEALVAGMTAVGEDTWEEGCPPVARPSEEAM